MRVSVVMLTYNREEMLSGMVQDVIKQTYQDFEFIIIDNGSIDGTWEYLQSLLDDRIVVRRLEESVSVGAARNIGVKMANGNYIAIVDDDDRIHPRYLDTLIGLSEQYGAEFSACGFSNYNEKKEEQSNNEEIVFSPEEAVVELVKRERIRAGLNVKLISRRLLLEEPLREDVVHEDVHSIYRYLANSNKVVYTDEPLYYFVRHGANLSAFQDDFGGMTRDKLAEYLEAYEIRCKWLTERFPGRKDYWEYSVWSFSLSMLSKMRKGIMPCYPELRDKMWAHFDEGYVKKIIRDEFLTDGDRDHLGVMKRRG